MRPTTHVPESASVGRRTLTSRLAALGLAGALATTVALVAAPAGVSASDRGPSGEARVAASDRLVELEAYVERTVAEYDVAPAQAPVVASATRLALAADRH
ncbi:hypothetical protein [Agromyces mariniharenae]|uniref:Uncharacterized protein n=1 Tax=Agromyces mariniharenae TaxID=2604423 RepID=A0A5S4V535_9MICO|nr:hypothetical protein [Agromyces mariniharenae]TYL54247.1 hypothetical protein FYC51_11835 [Agromyces mariniharenae]